MEQIRSSVALHDWLKDKPADWAQVIAARAALRVVPYAFTNRILDEWVENHSLTLVRALFVSWAARNVPFHSMTGAALAAADSAAALSRLGGSHTAFLAAANAADASAYAANAAFAAFAVCNTAEYAADADLAVWANIDHDCYWLTKYPDQMLASRQMTSVGLWLAGAPEGWRDAWLHASNRLRALSQGYEVWVSWCNLRFEGGNDMAFAIPGDIDRIEDKKILALLADATNEDFWDKGATYVNATLQRWIDEARERIQSGERLDEPPSPTPEAIRAIAAEIASPTVTLTNNKLDVATNTTFDGQTDAANLDEAIAVLRAVVGALLGGLPGNAPRSFAANLTIYDGELAKRDAKPFLGVLVRMEKSVSAGFHADPEMFDMGVTTNFESYFDAHLSFMTHYRRNEEREAKIAQFTIDDAAASGVALTGPVDEVVKEVDALAEQGLVTDGFVQAIKEQQAINYEVALYTSSAPAISGEPAVKKRIILQIVGILERALAVVNNLVSATAQFGAFVKVVKQAIAELLKFFV